MGSPLLDKSKAFALRIIKVCNEVKREKKESILTNQLVRSGTSIGANIAEAQNAQSRADFQSKLNIALKETTETKYWLRLLHATDYLTKEEFQSMESDCNAIERILSVSVKKLKKIKNCPEGTP